MIQSPSDMDEEQLQEAERISQLIAAYIQKTLSPAGHDELDAWVNAHPDNMLLFEELTDERERDKAMQWVKEVNTKAALAKVKQKIGLQGKPKRKKQLWYYIAAICMAVIVLVVALWRVNTEKHIAEDPGLVKTNDIKPGGPKAMLTLNDGSVLMLTDLRPGVLKNENGVLINKESEGQVVYMPSAASYVVNNSAYNTLTTPRGGEYMLILSDGTRIWLNASSSLKYPVTFSGGIRKVYLTGEAYFEVTNDAKHPFVVGFKEARQVTVLGTHFNLMEYHDEKAVKITLLEGAVKVDDSITLKQGEQYREDYTTGKSQVVPGIDTTEEISWKNGYFTFNNAPIPVIMRQLARWYDIQVSYENNMQEDSFTATVSRKEDINTVLTRLQKTGSIHFEINGKKVTVKK